MSRTSFKNIVIAGIIGATFIIVLLANYLSAGINYDLGDDFDNESLIAAAEFETIIGLAENSSATATNVTADKGLFDVIGGLILDGITTVRVVISGTQFVASSSQNLLQGGYFYVHPLIVLSIFTIVIFVVLWIFISRYITGKEDEQ